MPKKIRELKAMMRKAGFAWRRAKGSHTVWTHPKLRGSKVTVSGHDGDDAPDYIEKQVKEALEQVEGST